MCRPLIVVVILFQFSIIFGHSVYKRVYPIIHENTTIIDFTTGCHEAIPCNSSNHLSYYVMRQEFGLKHWAPILDGYNERIYSVKRIFEVNLEPKLSGNVDDMMYLMNVHIAKEHGRGNPSCNAWKLSTIQTSICRKYNTDEIHISSEEKMATIEEEGASFIYGCAVGVLNINDNSVLICYETTIRHPVRVHDVIDILLGSNTTAYFDSHWLKFYARRYAWNHLTRKMPPRKAFGYLADEFELRFFLTITGHGLNDVSTLAGRLLDGYQMSRPVPGRLYQNCLDVHGSVCNSQVILRKKSYFNSIGCSSYHGTKGTCIGCLFAVRLNDYNSSTRIKPFISLVKKVRLEVGHPPESIKFEYLRESQINCGRVGEYTSAYYKNKTHEIYRLVHSRRTFTFSQIHEDILFSAHRLAHTRYKARNVWHCDEIYHCRLVKFIKDARVTSFSVDHCNEPHGRKVIYQFYRVRSTADRLIWSFNILLLVVMMMTCVISFI